VIAFLTHLAEIVGPEEARFVHQGMTSSDVLDTCAQRPADPRRRPAAGRYRRVLAALKTRAMEHKTPSRIGRSHGIHAEPTTMGLTFATAYAEMDRNRAACAPPAPRSPPARFRARSAPSPISTRRSRNMSATGWA
jgi:adenylosuccinate lyase